MAAVTAKMGEQTKKIVPPTQISLTDNPSEMNTIPATLFKTLQQ